MVDHYDDDWSRLWWVRGDGPAHVVHAGAEHERAVAVLADKYPQYRRARPAGPVIVVGVAHWASWAP